MGDDPIAICRVFVDTDRADVPDFLRAVAHHAQQGLVAEENSPIRRSDHNANGRIFEECFAGIPQSAAEVIVDRFRFPVDHISRNASRCHFYNIRPAESQKTMRIPVQWLQKQYHRTSRAPLLGLWIQTSGR
jgi:hypothetical protein